ncbi:hypothetical protein AAP_03978 [Ascosphaera apis ARSEF 7405]|uniref:Sigma-70 region 2 family protein n=1 Tax=Ascosphaera apis ARSEF 7405 TaxID=392613 RepID=A0A167XFP0_9EURO|nr:hypothetical protein AAP_03978 [Ascosphaera apis ARSEF 7405]
MRKKGAHYPAKADLNPAKARPNAKNSLRDTSDPDTRFQFIDETGDTSQNSTRVRRHVMREVLRNRRSQNQGRQSQVADTRSGTSTGGAQHTFRIQPQKQFALRKKSSLVDTQDDTTCGRKVREEHGRQQQEQTFILSGVNPDRHCNGPQNFSVVSGDHLPAISAAMDIPLRYYESYNDWNNLPGSISSSSGLAQASTHDDEFGAIDAREDRLEEASGIIARSPVRTVLSAARKDPFDTLPLHLNEEDTALFDFYANVMPTFSYQSRIQHPRAHNWYAQVFIPEAMKGPISFQSTILVHASSCQGWMQGIPETERSLVQRTRSINMLRRHLLQYPDDDSDATITAILSTAAADDFDPRLECKRTSWMHLRAAMQKIRNRGGPEAFKDNRRLAMLINWQDYIIVGYEMDGPSFFYEHKDYSEITGQGSIVDDTTSLQNGTDFSQEIPACVSSSQNIALFELRQQTEIFLTFLHSVESLSLIHRNTPTHSLPPCRYTTFCQDALLYKVLKSPLGTRYVTSGMRKQIISRMAALMMLNAALWDYRYIPSRIECLLDGLRRKVRETSIGNIDCVEAVLQLLLEGNDTFDLEDDAIAAADMRWPPTRPGSTGVAGSNPSYEPETPSYLRPWFIGRMLKVVKRLGRDSWWRVNDHLFDLLSMEFEGPLLNTSGWEDELREEILAAPLTSYIMPSMM